MLPRRFQNSAKSTHFDQLAIYSVIGISLILVPTNSITTCPFHKYFGIYCPGCGSIRAIHSIEKGNFGLALHENALLFATPFLMLAGSQLSKTNRKGLLYAYYLALVILTLGFTLERNRPNSPFAPRAKGSSPFDEIGGLPYEI